jgi:WD40 repeat protein/HPt (histidine-containing phosphotransfer) domain-containing protein
MALDLEKLVEFVDEAVHHKTSRRLRDVEVWIFKGSWNGQTYGEIADAHSYTSQYLQQDVGPKFWKLLSDVFEEQLSKRNFQTVLERHYRQQTTEIAEPEVAQSSLGRSTSIRAEPAPESSGSQPLLSHTASPTVRCDWGEAVDVSTFYGREQELETLAHWILGGSASAGLPPQAKPCRVVALLGMGGMGKTTLATKLAETLQDQFDVVVWRSLRNAATISEILDEWLQFLSNQTALSKPERLDKKLSQLLTHLREQRCLLILDNLESVLQVGQPSGTYSPGFEGYGQLIRWMADTQHHSCLLLTSREKPVGLAQREGPFVRSLQIQGLSQQDSQELFADKGCDISDFQVLQEICTHYSGNPLALKIVAAAIQELTGGDTPALLPLLRRGTFEFDDINDLLARQCSRLSSIELQVMYWLAINRQPVTLLDLETDAVWDAVSGQFPAAIRSLSQRSLIERQKQLISLQPAVMEYITQRLVNEFSTEIIAEQPNLLHQYALLKAQSEDYIRQAQRRFILQPLISHLLAALGSQQKIEQCCKNMLAQSRQDHPFQASYIAGNLLNLLIELEVDLSGLDCSDLFIWQAYLAGKTLRDINFSNAHFSRTVFTTVLGVAISMAYSPDNTLLAIGNTDNKIHLWHIQRSEEFMTLEGHTSWVLSVAFSPDGTKFASGSLDRAVKIWDLETGQCLHTLQGHLGWVWSVTFHPDSQTLVSGGNDQSIKVWDVSSGDCRYTLQNQPSGVESVAFSPDGTHLACGRDNYTIELWQTNPWQTIKVLTGHRDWVRSVVFCPDGQTVVSGSSDSTLKVWDVDSGECIRTLAGHSSLINCIALSPDGKILGSSSSDCTVRLWDVEAGQCLKVLQGHAVGVWSVAFDASGQTLVSGSNDSVIKFWDVQTGQALKTFQGYCAGIKALAPSFDGLTFASGGDDPAIRIWNCQTGECFHTLPGRLSWLWCMAYSHCNSMLACGGGGDYSIDLWNVETAELIQTLQGHANLVFAVAFSPDDRILATSSIDTTVRLWNVETGQCFRVLPHDGRVWSVQFCLGQQSLLSSSEDMTVRRWEIESGECVQIYRGHAGQVLCIALSADGQMIASGGDDTIIKLWDFDTGNCLENLKGHQATIRSVVLSADGRLLASSGDDKTVRVWDLDTMQCIHILQGHQGEVWKVAFTTDALQVISGSQDGTIRMWDVATGECTRSLRAKRPYEGMDITNVTGVAEAQQASLKLLGAIAS